MVPGWSITETDPTMVLRIVVVLNFGMQKPLSTQNILGKCRISEDNNDKSNAHGGRLTCGVSEESIIGSNKAI